MGNTYHFKLGAFDCFAVSDGGMNYPPQRLFKDISPQKIRDHLAARGLPATHVYTPYTLLLIDTGSDKVLVDTGIGKYAAGTKDGFAAVDDAGMRAGIALESLAEAGIGAEEIDTVVITHAHPDHVGGNFDVDGRPCFPNARFVIWREEWDFWFSDERIAQRQVQPHFVEMARANLGPLRDEIFLLDGGEEIVPGISAVPTPGHTPGHLAVRVDSQGERLVHISDAVLLPIHLELPGVVTQYDILPEQNLATRQWLCDLLSEEGALVFAHHFGPYPNLGMVQKWEDGWRWCPYI